MKTDTLYRLIWLSRPLMQAAEASVEKGLDGTGLTVRMRAVLEILLNIGDATVPDLAQKLEIKRQFVQVMVNETLGEGLTTRRPNPRHKTSPLISLTEKGRRIIKDVIAREMALVETLGTQIDEVEAETALRVMSTIIDGLRLRSNGQAN